MSKSNGNRAVLYHVFLVLAFVVNTNHTIVTFIVGTTKSDINMAQLILIKVEECLPLFTKVIIVTQSWWSCRIKSPLRTHEEHSQMTVCNRIWTEDQTVSDQGYMFCQIANSFQFNAKHLIISYLNLKHQWKTTISYVWFVADRTAVWEHIKTFYKCLNIEHDFSQDLITTDKIRYDIITRVLTVLVTIVETTVIFVFHLWV